MERILVLMSTYNGEKNIIRQLNSIVAQTNVDVHCLIRDDGSTDNTVRVISEYQAKRKNIRLIQGNNFGWKKSFMQLVYETANLEQFDYYAFADQDDIWNEDKLSIAINTISKESKPALYASQVSCYNEKLQFLRNVFVDDKGFEELEKYSAIGVSPYGCTMCWNRALNISLLEHRPQIEVCHDIWVNLVARLNGKVFIDKQSHFKHILYDNNACGVSTTRIERIKKFFKIYMSKNFLPASKMLKEYYELYGVKENDKNSFPFKLSKLGGGIRYSLVFLCDKTVQSMSYKRKIRTILFVVLGKM
jgi:rhamnosyltransferase